jgi:hypothetical protein
MVDLSPFIGRWRSRGRTVDDPPIAIEGTDVYEWFPGGGFVVHHVDVRFGDDEVRVIELIGDPDPEADEALRMRSFDNRGEYAQMWLAVDTAGVWTLTDRTASRSTVTFAPDGTRMTARWERSPDGGTAWKPWMTMEFSREA